MQIAESAVLSVAIEQGINSLPEPQATHLADQQRVSVRLNRLVDVAENIGLRIAEVWQASDPRLAFTQALPPSFENRSSGLRLLNRDANPACSRLRKLTVKARLRKSSPQTG